MTGSGDGARFALSASDRAVPLVSDAEFARWWESRPRHELLSVERVGFDHTRSWSFSAGTGDLVHESGGFFSVRGLRVASGGAVVHQPVIDQPEIGILGILVKEFDGVPHFLMQAKFEPGNVNLRQISPTVQATRSNYTGVHGGRATPYVEYFRAPRRGRVLVDVLQSEQGEWFWRKHNRNIVVEVGPDEEVPEHEDYRWFTLRQIHGMLRRDNLVNMDARTVLSCLPVARGEGPEPADPFGRALARSYGDGALHPMTGVVSWFTEAKTVVDWRSELLPLPRAEGWRRTGDEISGGPGFRIIMVSVSARIREVASWTQPLLAPERHGFAAFLVREIGGVLHVLVRARAEPGTLDRVEITPTVQYSASAEALGRPEPFAAQAESPPAHRVRYDALLSEEGGRFHHAQTRYRIVEADPDLPAEVPPDFLWVTVAQLMELVRHGHYLNIEARTLLVCLHTLG
ncbi:NDP-hexose 2,3-dehydratase family protein [Nocardiopsis dassonvillei]|uniref:NDP-hexose 2,3-dehydratase family protein n=1 Tax=Nocardiopsis dassonvillei TaxID=2014 RepID=UPI0020A3CCB7|nr:NDP-hexose 2,3-dehydratase family protein [Nocardiopsis dassonvillei]MCP3015089.1 NDP-hexose 2,3-dehydratase family protein [Nocardiopsis dassonvillei]